MDPIHPGEGRSVIRSIIVFNDILLSEQQIEEFKKIYGQAPMEGKYWYDKLSGLYGIDGHPASGFMYAGHDYGTLVPHASNGNTRVFINERELPQTEYSILSQLLGNFVLPGSYWLDAQGNAGMKGNSFPLVNLVMASQKLAYQPGGSGGGDNFWSSRYGAGNYSDDGSCGYVSVPGYGAVSYGM